MYFEKIKQEFDEINKENEKLGKVCKVLAVFSILIIPIFIQGIIHKKMLENQKKQYKIIEYYVIDCGIYDIYNLIDTFYATFVYKSLTELFTTTMTNYKFSNDMTHIIKATDNDYECNYTKEQKYNYYCNFYIKILNEIVRVGFNHVTLPLSNARSKLEKALIIYTLNSDECVDLQYFVDWYNGLINYNMRKVGYALFPKMTEEKAKDLIEKYNDEKLIKIDIDKDNNLLR